MTIRHFIRYYLLTFPGLEHIILLLNDYRSFVRTCFLQTKGGIVTVKLGKGIVKMRFVILGLCLLLLVPATIGFIKTQVNYDILYYLPDDIETMQGQEILKEDFGKGAFAMLVVEGMNAQGVEQIKENVQDVAHVEQVIWYTSAADLSIPIDALPDTIQDAFNTDDATVMAVFFDDGTSADSTLSAVKEIRSITGKQCFLSGMSATVEDTKDLSNAETPIYVLLAVIFSMIVLSLFLDNFLLPLVMMLSIGIAILYNLGSNYFLGEISFITKAISAVLQLGVTMDYSVFLWHSYVENKQRYPGEKNRAMAHAIANSFTAIVGGSFTNIAGFLSLCFMSFTLGMDLGIVMAKGVVIGVIACMTLLPSLILVFDTPIEKSAHRQLIPEMHGIARFIVNHHFAFVLVFLVLIIPAFYSYTHTDVYYNIDKTLPRDLDSVIASEKLQDEFDMNSTHMVLASADLPAADAQAMLNEMSDVDGVKAALGLNSLISPDIPEDAIPNSVNEMLKSDKWQLMLVSSEYKVASDDVNNQITELNDIIKKYDKSAMLIGEAPLTKDLITITDTDFRNVQMISTIAIFIIIALVFRSISIPILLVAAIKLAIFINLGIPYYTGTEIPFISTVVIETIQLGATVDYAILMTARYRKERFRGSPARDAIYTALSTSIRSVLVSGLGFFAATIGVGIYSSIGVIGSLCMLMARGALISMFLVIFVLPSLFLVFDKIICKTSMGFIDKRYKLPKVPETTPAQ